MNEGVQMLPAASDPKDQHEPFVAVTPQPTNGESGELWRLESDGTRYDVYVTDDPWSPEFAIVCFDSHGNGHGEWARLLRSGTIASTYIDEKFKVRSEVDLFHLTRLIGAALGRTPHQTMPLVPKEL